MEIYLFGIGLIISLLLHFLAERSQIVVFIFCKISFILPIFYKNPLLTMQMDVWFLCKTNLGEIASRQVVFLLAGGEKYNKYFSKDVKITLLSVWQ